MTRVQRVIFNAGAWMPRPTPTPGHHADLASRWRATPSALVPDLCHELSRELTWAVYGESVIPADASPRGVNHRVERRARQRRDAHLAGPQPARSRVCRIERQAGRVARFGLY